jgi:hypothetical protein
MRAMHTFILRGLDPAGFEPLFGLPDSELRARAIQRRIADAHPGFPCRVSLDDAGVGEELLLLPYEHHAVASPYRAAGPIFVRRGARAARLAPGEVPPYVTRRLISLRAYDASALMRDASVCAGHEVAAQLEGLLQDPAVAYIHLHNAKQGCYSCRAERFRID